MRILLAFILVLFFTGCGVKHTTFNELTPNFSPQNRFDNSVELYVNGLSMSEPIFYAELEKAITNSIQNSRIFTNVTKSNGDYKLNAFVVNVYLPPFAITFDSNVEIAWSLKHKDRVVFRRSYITNSMQTRDSFMGADRALSARNVAIRENIKLALYDISKLKL